ncbi:hypothetical protein [Leifsonia poae]|uniref:hypothetical protein n=1 Tax=Leifsonia poae TaxID=110933 RepID=UPI003D673BD1
MRKPERLPEGLASAGFTVADARAAGVPRKRLYAADLQSPFFGMRTSGVDLADHIQLCRAAATVLPPGTFFSHRSAAVLHGLPVPLRALPLHPEVSVFDPSRPPEIVGVDAHQLTWSGQQIATVEGLPVIGAADTWAQLSRLLPVGDLVVLGDFLVTGSEPYTGHPPPTDRERLEAAVRRHGRRRGVQSLRLALERVRYGSLSPQESRLRLALVDAGLPEPELNYRIEEDGTTIAMIDLAYPLHKVAVEYLGDHHRTDRETYRNDIHRRELLVDRAWSVILVTAADDLHHAALRTRRALLQSTPGETPI